MTAHASPALLDFLAKRRETRAYIESRIELWIGLLDDLDALTEDFEPVGDDEPSLGSLGSVSGVPHFHQAWWATCGDEGDRERGDILDEPHDDEPDQEAEPDEENGDEHERDDNGIADPDGAAEQCPEHVPALVYSVGGYIA